MKTLRTIFLTLAVVCLAFFAVCILSLNLNSDYLRRTVFYVFQRGKLISVIMCSAFTVIALILSFALHKFNSLRDKAPSIFDDEPISDDKSKYKSVARKASGFKQTKPVNVRIRAKASQYSEEKTSDDNFSFDDCVNVGATYSATDAVPANSITSFCLYCGAKLSKNSVFCDNCGKKVQ